MKHEARSTKFKTNSKSQLLNSKPVWNFRFWSLGFVSDFGFRISGFQQRERPAFTLLETIVALALVASALAGPFALASRGVFGAKFYRSKLVALNLSQEGIEIIRHMRENNKLGNFDWRGLSGSCTGSCTRLQNGSYQPDVFTAAQGGTPPLNTNTPLRFDAASGLYNQSSGESTAFTRVVDISTPAADQMQVVSTVAWTESGIPRQVQLAEVLYNWQ